MIRNTARLVGCTVAVWSMSAFISSGLIAQHGPGRHAAGASEHEGAPPTNLTGEWRLNTELSDDIAKAMQSMHGTGDGRAPSGGAGGHGPWRHGGGGGHGGMDPGQMQAIRTRLSRAIDAPARLTITQADGSITLTDGEGRSQTLTTNKQKEKRPLDGRMVGVRTTWDDGRLVTETFLDDGLKRTETYSLVTDPRQLHVLVKLEGSPLPRAINVRRVYDGEGAR